MHAVALTTVIMAVLISPTSDRNSDPDHNLSCNDLEQFRRDAIHGDQHSQTTLGWIYFTGKCIPQDTAEAIRLERQAARQHSTKAEAILGVIYQSESNEKEALLWIKASAAHGDPLGESMLGWAYYNGRGVPRNLTQAANWAQMSARHDSPWGDALLGLLYLRGQVMPQDDDKAARWERRAADLGNSEGEALLGMQYFYGRGVPKDYNEATKWERLSAEQGNPDGESALSWSYHKGTGLLQDDVEAVKWAKQAAKQGNTGAKQFLGDMYKDGGGGLPRDYIEADKWYILANKSGSVLLLSQAKLELIMPEQDINEAHRRAACWRDKPFIGH